MKEPEGMSKIDGLETMERTCGTCGKKFVAISAERWGYRRKSKKTASDIYFCGYKCMREYDKMKAEKGKNEPVKAEKPAEKIEPKKTGFGLAKAIITEDGMIFKSMYSFAAWLHDTHNPFGTTQRALQRRVEHHMKKSEEEMHEVCCVRYRAATEQDLLRLNNGQDGKNEERDVEREHLHRLQESDGRMQLGGQECAGAGMDGGAGIEEGLCDVAYNAVPGVCSRPEDAAEHQDREGSGRSEAEAQEAEGRDDEARPEGACGSEEHGDLFRDDAGREEDADEVRLHAGDVGEAVLGCDAEDEGAGRDGETFFVVGADLESLEVTEAVRDPNRIAWNLVRLRKRANMTQMQVASALGYSGHKTVAGWETAKLMPGLASCMKLARIYRTTLECIATGVPDESVWLTVSKEHRVWQCGACGHLVVTEENIYCPRCGRRMVKERNQC